MVTPEGLGSGAALRCHGEMSQQTDTTAACQTTEGSLQAGRQECNACSYDLAPGGGGEGGAEGEALGATCAWHGIVMSLVTGSPRWNRTVPL